MSAERRHADPAENWRQPWDQRLPEGIKYMLPGSILPSEGETEVTSEFSEMKNEKFFWRCVSQRLAMDPRCKGMPLSSFLLKPMQRVTRYPLIIKNVRTAHKHISPTVTEGVLRLSITSIFEPQIHSFLFFRPLIIDLRKYSRLTSRPQPPESCPGEGRGAVLAGEHTHTHNLWAKLLIKLRVSGKSVASWWCFRVVNLNINP